MREKGDRKMIANIQLSSVTDYVDVLKNAKQYQADIKNDERLIKKLSHVQHWYYFEEGQFFASSKFIGYKDNHADLYEEYANKGMSGTETEPILKKWFIKLERESQLEEQLLKELEHFLNQYDKKPNKRVCIHVKR